MITREIPLKVKSQVGVTALDATADTITVNGDIIELICVSGNLWYRIGATAVANATASLLEAGSGDRLVVPTTISIISDGSGATYQYKILEA